MGSLDANIGNTGRPERFSARLGIAPADEKEQIGCMNAQLRNRIWNTISVFVGYQDWTSIARVFAHNILKVSYEEVPGFNDQARDWTFVKFSKLSWYEVYDFAEYLQLYLNNGKDRRYSNRLNEVFYEERAGYRLSEAGLLFPITSSVEIEEIEKSLPMQIGDSFRPAREHLKRALEAFSKRPISDNTNTVKESIAAVESATRIVLNDTSVTLGQATGKLKEHLGWHPAFGDAMSKLYGWTSDAAGIRHGATNLESVGYEEARFMLVICSAFVNYMILKNEQMRAK